MTDQSSLQRNQARKLVGELNLKAVPDHIGVYFTKISLQVNALWEILLAGTNGSLPMTKDLYFDPSKSGLYINIVELSGIRARASLNEDIVAPWTSGMERMRLDNFFGNPLTGISSRPTQDSMRVILQRYSRHPKGLPISKKILSIPDAERPHLFAEGTNALVVYFVKAPFEITTEPISKRISADSKQFILDIIEKHPSLSAERIQEIAAKELDGVNVPDLKRIQFQQKKYLKNLFMEKRPKRIAECRVMQSEIKKDDFINNSFNYDSLLGNLGLKDQFHEEETGRSFVDFEQMEDQNSTSNLSPSPLDTLLMQTSHLSNQQRTSPQPIPSTSYETFEERIPSYYMDLNRGLPVQEALKRHGSIPEVGNLFTGAQRIVMDGIVKTLNELLKSKTPNEVDDDTGISVLQLFPDVKTEDSNAF